MLHDTVSWEHASNQLNSTRKNCHEYQVSSPPACTDTLEALNDAYDSMLAACRPPHVGPQHFVIPLASLDST